jgi:ATP-dependent DNA helicase RecG
LAHDNQYEIDFPRPAGLRLLTPDEIYANPDVAILSLIKEDRRIEKKPATYQCRALGDYFSMWANTPPDGGLIVIGMEDDGTVGSGCETVTQHRVNELECTGSNFCPDARHEIRKVPVLRADGVADSVLVFRIFYNKDKVVKTNAGKAFRRRGESKYEIPLKEVRELEHEKGEVDFEQEPVDLVFPDAFDMALVNQFCDKVREVVELTQHHANEEILIQRRLGFRTARGFQPNVACTLLFATDPLIKFPGCKTRFLRFEGEHEHSGSSFNAVKDVTLEGHVPYLIVQTAKLVDSQLRTFSKLGGTGNSTPIRNIHRGRGMRLLSMLAYTDPTA